MFELSLARKYLIPRRRQLSVALISLLSVGVISLVVWLVLIFLSITEGIEKSWLHRLTTLNAPVRITPTQEYYSSYYYLVDSLSSQSDFAPKSIEEKLTATISDPYQPESDQEIPLQWPLPDYEANQTLRDPVKKAWQILEEFQKKSPGLTFQDYEMSGALLQLTMKRPDPSVQGVERQSHLTQVSYIASLPQKSPHFSGLIIENAPRASSQVKRKHAAEIWLPKSFLDNGVFIGDEGYLSYSAPTASSVQEQRLPVQVVGFYDPGPMSVGGRLILAPSIIPRAINSAGGAFAIDRQQANGINVWFSDLKQADAVKQELLEAFQKAGIDRYWSISTFREFEFAKDLLGQFQSDKYLFTLVGAIILSVASCNIISLLVLLVNDKKREIGILQALGASKKSIAGIFALSGVCMGIVGCVIGLGLALLTLHNIDTVVGWISFLQGHEAFNAVFYGKSLPSELSPEATTFVLILTPLLSLLAGVVPAWKAARLEPSAILRSE